MDQAVADRIGDTGLPNRRVPCRRRQLARDQGRRAFAAIFNHLQQVPAFRIGERREQPIIDGDQIKLREFGQQPRIGSVPATDGDLAGAGANGRTTILRGSSSPLPRFLKEKPRSTSLS